MKKVLLCSLLLSMFIVLDAVAANEPLNNAPTGGVMCNKKRTRCTVGNQVMQGTINHPLYVRDGIVCNYKRTRCTNGYSIQISRKPQY